MSNTGAPLPLARCPVVGSGRPESHPEVGPVQLVEVDVVGADLLPNT